MSNPFDVIRQFEKELARYTGARFAVATTSCTTALLISLAYFRMCEGTTTVSLPKFTYVGVAHSVLNAGHKLEFRDEDWQGKGLYQLSPFPIYDSARLLTSGMFVLGAFQCLSFHWAKHLGIGQGGAILHDSPRADDILRQMRFDGRTEGVAPADDQFITPAYHAYMMPRDAAEGLTRLALLPKDNKPLPEAGYADLSKVRAFR